jgi:hypothetical protein
MVNYVNDSSNVEPFLELLSTLDANAAGVDYVAGMGTGIIELAPSGWTGIDRTYERVAG